MSDSKQCIGGWTVDTLNRAMRDLMEERRIQVNERFRLLEASAIKLEELLFEYKKETNSYRSTFLPLELYRSEHRQLSEKLDHTAAALTARLSAMDDERNKIKDDVTIIKSRSGYVSTALMVSVLSGIGGLLLAIWHIKGVP